MAPGRVVRMFADRQLRASGQQIAECSCPTYICIYLSVAPPGTRTARVLATGSGDII